MASRRPDRDKVMDMGQAVPFNVVASVVICCAPLVLGARNGWLSAVVEGAIGDHRLNIATDTALHRSCVVPATTSTVE